MIFSAWLRAAWRRDVVQLREYAAKAAMSELTGQTGGYLVPPDLLPEVLGLVYQQSIVWPRAFVVNMMTATIDVPVIDVTRVPSSGDAPYFGGMQLRWTGEGDTIGETEPTFKQVGLAAHELTGYAVVSNALLQDSPAMNDALPRIFASAMAWFTDQAFIVGGGIGRPLGMLNTANPALLTVTEVSGSFGLAMAQAVGKFLPQSFPYGVWLIHPTYFAKLLSRAAAADAAPSTAVTNSPFMYAYGFPVLSCDQMASGSGNIVAALVDCSKYLVGSRVQLEIAFSPDYKFTNNQTVVRVVIRVDGRPMFSNVVTLPDTTTTVSPFVGIVAA